MPILPLVTGPGSGQTRAGVGSIVWVLPLVLIHRLELVFKGDASRKAERHNVRSEGVIDIQAPACLEQLVPFPLSRVGIVRVILQGQVLVESLRFPRAPALFR